MRFAVGVSAAFGAGLIIGVGAGWVALEDRLSKKYEESMESIQRAYELALNVDPVEGIDLEYNRVAIIPDEFQPPATHDTMGSVEIYDPKAPHNVATQNPYHQAVAAPPTPLDAFVNGTANAEGIAYIEEEEYQEEDGRLKQRIEVLVEDANPVFFLDGQILDDWADRVGSSILADMYERVPHGLDMVLYVRNFRTDEDYEVVMVSP